MEIWKSDTDTTVHPNLIQTSVRHDNLKTHVSARCDKFTQMSAKYNNLKIKISARCDNLKYSNETRCDNLKNSNE